MAHSGLDDSFHRRYVEHAAGRVRGRGQDDGAGSIADGVDDPVGVEGETVGGRQRNLDGIRTRQACLGEWIRPGRRRHYHFVAGIGHRQQRQVERLDAAGRHDHSFRVGVNTVGSQPIGDGPSERIDPRVRRVVGCTAVRRHHRRFHDVLRRGKIGLSEFEMN